MKIAFFRKLEGFYANHPETKELLRSWSKRIQDISPKHFVELREFFQQADQVGELTVFNIGSNYRLIAQIDYESQKTIIREVLPHKEYERGKWKKQ
jgi:mRNA interferase HigB